MSQLKAYLLVGIFIFVAACASQKKIQSEDDFTAEPAPGISSADTAADGELSLEDDSSGLASPAASGQDEFADFESGGSKPEGVAPTSDDDLALENELNSLDANANPVAKAPEAPPQPEIPPAVESAPQVETPAVVAAPTEEPAPQTSAPAAVSQINSIDYKSNASGGTILINADQPLQYTTRVNSATNQLVVEVQNSIIPKKLKRSLNTKDMASSIGSVDIYQKPNSKISRFVVQLRPGSSEPLVQQEGNTLLIVGGSNPSYVSHKNTSNDVVQASSGEPVDVNPDMTSEGIMSTQSLEDFLMSNNRFYGKKISIETNNLDVKDAIKFIAEESGVNMIMDDGLDGKVSLKLRQVPWDQALVLLLKSKKLGYKRQGNVLRIAKIGDIQKEEADGIRLREEKVSAEPLIVKRFFIGYADIKELETKIKDFIGSTSGVNTATTAATPAAGAAPAAPVSTPSVGRARVISDTRTSSLIVTDTQTNMLKIEKLIAALDTQPQQVLIEGKVIEAREGFSRQMGVVWASNPTGVTGANSARVNITPELGSTQSILSTQLTWGQLDVLGNLTAQLRLGEREDKARVLSSPRVTVLSNQVANISQTTGLLIPKLEVTSNGVTTIANEVVPVGVSLKVTPQVSNEGTVTLDMDIERSFLAKTDSKTPDSRKAKTKVIVKSGQTAVIGGIFETNMVDGVSGIPGLKDIPILGMLFSGKTTNKDKNELVIFITPHILPPIAGDKKSSSFE